MKARQSAGSNLIGLISIVIIYILLIVLVLHFAQQVLFEISTGETLENLIYIPLALVLPLFLFVSIIVNVVRIIREKQSKKPGITYKIRLILFFVFISVLSSIPQGILSINFINTAMESWFSEKIETALEGGLSIALQYNRESIRHLETFSASPILDTILNRHIITEETEEVKENQILFIDALWQDIKQTYPWITGIEIFNSQGNQVFFRGKQETELGSFTERVVDRYTEPGIIARFKSGPYSVIQGLRPFNHQGEEYSLVLSITLLDHFDDKATTLTEALLGFSQYQQFQTTFFFAVLFFYSFFSLPILLLSILTGFLLSNEIIKPIEYLEHAIYRVIEGDFSFRILYRPKDELSTLVQSFNTMVAELEQSRRKLRQTEKVTAWQEIAQRMAHEIKNPLTPIKLSAQRLIKNYQQSPINFDEMLDTSVNTIIREVDNLNHMLQEFRDFAKLPSPKLTPINLESIIMNAVWTYSENYPKITIDTKHLQPYIIQADQKQMYQVFSNIIKNAFEAIQEKGSITISSDLVRRGNSDYCRIQIEDSGCGIETEQQSQVFNPYYTTKRQGTGLGLPIVERIIKDHKGEIWFETEQGVGTTFFIDLPWIEDHA